MDMLDSVGSMARTAVRKTRDRSDDGPESWETNAPNQPEYSDDRVTNLHLIIDSS